MQHHALEWLALALAAVRPTAFGTLDKAGRVQLRLHPGVAPPKAVVAHQVLVKMLHVPAQVSSPVQLQHQLGIRRRNALRRRFAEPPVEKAVYPVFFVAVAIPSELPL